MLDKIVFTVACLVLPVLWGAAVNWIFNLWQDKTADKQENESVFPDYQI